MRDRIPSRIDFDPAAYASRPRAGAGRSRETAVTVTALNNSIKDLLDQKFKIAFWIQGEITGFKRHQSGHWYFSLRDSISEIACVMWSKDQKGLPATPDEGMKVFAHAELSVHAQKARIQLRVLKIEAEGDGLWRKAIEETIARLKAEGLLAPERKRRIPLCPRSLGVVTSPSGAALHDIISVATRRRPGIEIIVSCCSVQGDSAPRELCDALSRLRKWKSVDVVIIGRGGGAVDDLRAFNHEAVARAIAACHVPVISAIGHEVDRTICDLVADYCAATPSAAAERAVPALSELRGLVDARRSALVNAAQHRTVVAHSDLKTTARDLRRAAVRVVERRQSVVASVAGRLNALSPLATLSRGYAVARRPDGEALTSAEQFSTGDPFNLTLHDGTIKARTESSDHQRSG